MSELCDECSMQWQPMPQEERLKALVVELVEALCEYTYGSCSELLDRAWEVEDE